MRSKSSRRNSFLYGFASFIIFFSVFSLSLPYLGKADFNGSQNIDYIVVLTGDKGRIEEALNQMKNYPNTPLLISGVNEKLNLKDLSPLGIKGSRADQNIKIDYAHNTLENILFMFKELRDHPSVKTILLISSDYHLFRVQRLIAKFNKEDYQFTFQKIEHDFSIRKLFLEGLKNIRNAISLIFWIG